ncbi:MAG: DUF3800 domain-containing protein [Coriobacteriia bacterium]|nr:DUF3800 domain-containing protein [Coriobacteriia bacterium]
MSVISVFLDESGSAGTDTKYYVLTLVFHDQDKPIESQLARLSEGLDRLGFPSGRALHTSPIIRQKDEYKNMSLDTRRHLFDQLFTFTRVTGVKYKSFVIKNKEYPDRVLLSGRLSRELSLFFKDNLEYFQSFNTVNVYYDNGQAEVTALVYGIFSATFFNVDIRKVVPSDYRLFQVADLLCTLELSNAKVEANELSKAEDMFFKGRRRLIKDYLKSLAKMRF